MTVAQLETRLRKVEQGLADLSRAVHRHEPSRRWYATHAGRFANDPIFDEIVRLGKQRGAAMA